MDATNPQAENKDFFIDYTILCIITKWLDVKTTVLFFLSQDVTYLSIHLSVYRLFYFNIKNKLNGHEFFQVWF